MTTSDDEPRFDGPADDPNDTADQPVDLVPGDDGPDDEAYGPLDPDETPVAATPPVGRFLLAILGGLAVALLGVVVWAMIVDRFDRQYVGVAVIVGLVIGWLMRVVSGRTGLGVRIAAALVTAVHCVLGVVAAQAMFAVNQFRGVKFFDIFDDLIRDDVWNLLTDSKVVPVLSYVIFAAAMVLAFLSAGPQKEPKKKRKSAEDEETTHAAPDAEDEAVDPLAEPATEE